MSDLVGRVAAQPKTVYRGRRVKKLPPAELLELTDDRWTPRALFEGLRVPFTIDVAASEKNTKCERFFDRAADGLIQSWAGEIVWCNPPYSNIGAWLEKGHVEMARGCRRVTYLLPANRTEQTWWHDFVEPWRDDELGIETVYIKGRVRFECATGVVKSESGARGGKKNKGGAQPPFASVFIHFTQPWRVPLVVMQGELFGGGS
ncbi:MAG TPA: DNA N-6-adenine-methyltransferase [Polyangiaceae bacterium]|jgi:phage N-6-adenine-methyltransferase